MVNIRPISKPRRLVLSTYHNQCKHFNNRISFSLFRLSSSRSRTKCWLNGRNQNECGLETRQRILPIHKQVPLSGSYWCARTVSVYRVCVFGLHPAEVVTPRQSPLKHSLQVLRLFFPRLPFRFQESQRETKAILEYRSVSSRTPFSLKSWECNRFI